MGKTNKSKKFAKIKRTLNPNDKRLKSVNEKLKKKEEMRAESCSFIFFIQ